MREIKFRAWHPLNKEMVYEKKGQNFGYGGYTRSNILKDFEDDNIMQYTGLKDKNGREIYEGDVFGEYNRLLESGVEILGTIVFDNDLGSFVIHKENGGFEYLGKFLLEEKRAEIVGNIYENPELLNNGQEDKRSVATEAKYRDER